MYVIRCKAISFSELIYRAYNSIHLYIHICCTTLISCNTAIAIVICNITCKFVATIVANCQLLYELWVTQLYTQIASCVSSHHLCSKCCLIITWLHCWVSVNCCPNCYLLLVEDSTESCGDNVAKLKWFSIGE